MLSAYFTGRRDVPPCGLCDVCVRPEAAREAMTADRERSASSPSAPWGRRARPGAHQPPPPSALNSPLAADLRGYRLDTARALEWKAFMVFSNRVIDALCNARPTTLAALADVPGMGPAKVERFGPAIVEIIRRHAGP
jgi:superfamily II DNA helicase RecQ